MSDTRRLPTLEAESIRGRGERIKHLFTLIEQEPGHTEQWYHGQFLKAWPVHRRTWAAYVEDCLLMYDLLWVYDPEISKDARILYVRYQWNEIRNAKEEERVRKMKLANQLKLAAFEK